MRWRVGDVTIDRVTELETASLWKYLWSDLPAAELAAMPWLAPFLDDAGNLLMSVHSFVVRTPDLTLVVDTCIGNDKERAYRPWLRLQTDFLGRLAAIGVERARVDRVLCTHLHVDHVGWNTMLAADSSAGAPRWVPTFPHARYLFAEAEWAHWAHEPQPYGPVVEDSVQPVVDAGLVDLVQPDHVVCPEVRLVPTPGHTPGHVSVLVESRGERALVTGDTLHHPCQVGRPEWSSSADGDPNQAAVTRRQLLEDCADDPILVLGSHWVAPTAGRIVRDGDAFRLG